MRLALLVCAILSTVAPAGAATNFYIDYLSDGVYAAVVRPGGEATSNAFFVEGDEYVVIGGAHLTAGVISELESAVRAVTDKPVRYYILSHHHPGFSRMDFDIPPGRDVIMSWQTWQVINEEFEEIPYPVLFYSDGITLKLGGRTLILTNVEKGHTRGDTLVYLPDSQILFAGDLLYVGSVGYMGDGHMQEWVLALELMERLAPKKVIPGQGPVSGPQAIGQFKTFFRDFLTEILTHIEQGDSPQETVLLFSLPRYRHLDGFEKFLKVNVERAYQDLKTNLVR